MEPSSLLREFEHASLTFDDLTPGLAFMTPGRTVTEADVVNFAGLSGDFHALHMDDSFAAGTPHGRRIAHGLLVVAMTSGLVAKMALARLTERATLGLSGIECRFLKPVFLGDTIRVRVEVAGKQAGRRPDRGTVALRRTVLNQHDDIVLEGEWKIVLRTRPPGPERGTV